MRIRPNAYALAATLLLLLLCSEHVVFGQDTCPVQYGLGSKPMLFGGLYEAGRCTSFSGCQPRDDLWGKKCNFQAGSAWGLCTNEQTKRSYDLLKNLGGGSILDLSPCDMLPYLRGRTTWLIGDSHSKTFYRALQCFLIDFWDHQECQASPVPEFNAQLLQQPIKQGLNNCIHLLGQGGGRVCMVEAVIGTNLVNNTEIAEGGVLPLLRTSFAQQNDIFLVNFGSWHRRSSGDWTDYYTALHNLGKYYQSTRGEWPHLLFRESAATHPADKANQKCLEAQGYAYSSATGELFASEAAATDKGTRWALGTPLMEAAAALLPKYELPIVPAGFNMSVLLYDNHPGSKWTSELDCSHYCHPGLPEAWIWYLFEAMRKGQAGIQPLQVLAAVSPSVPSAVVTESAAAPEASPAPPLTEVASLPAADAAASEAAMPRAAAAAARWPMPRGVVAARQVQQDAVAAAAAASVPVPAAPASVASWPMFRPVARPAAAAGQTSQAAAVGMPAAAGPAALAAAARRPLQARNAMYVYDAATAGVAGSVPVGSYRALQQQGVEEQQQQQQQEEMYYPAVTNIFPADGPAAATPALSPQPTASTASTASIAPAPASPAPAGEPNETTASGSDAEGVSYMAGAADAGAAAAPVPLPAGQYMCLPSKLRF